MSRPLLTEAERARIKAAKGVGEAEVLAAAYGVAVSTIHNIWTGSFKGGHRVVTAEVREMIVAGKAANKTNAELIRLSGFSECTVRQVLSDARAEGDMRAHPDPAIRAAAIKQREAASAAHRQGGAAAPDAKPALAPNSIEASLVARGMRPEVARLNAKVWRDRHARKNEGRGR
jgi:hypothetical protein